MLNTTKRTTVSLVKEHFDREGRLVVPVRHWHDNSPVRPGWKPWWVNVNLTRIPVRYVTYVRDSSASAEQTEGRST